MNGELRLLRKNLIVTLQKYIPTSNDNFNIFRQELTRLSSRYTDTNDCNTLNTISDGINRVDNNIYTPNKYIQDCENVISNNNNADMLRDISMFMDLHEILMNYSNKFN